jgi:hypothetical protein
MVQNGEIIRLLYQLIVQSAVGAGDHDVDVTPPIARGRRRAAASGAGKADDVEETTVVIAALRQRDAPSRDMGEADVNAL